VVHSDFVYWKNLLTVPEYLFQRSAQTEKTWTKYHRQHQVLRTKIILSEFLNLKWFLPALQFLNQCYQICKPTTHFLLCPSLLFILYSDTDQPPSIIASQLSWIYVYMYEQWILLVTHYCLKCFYIYIFLNLPDILS